MSRVHGCTEATIFRTNGQVICSLHNLHFRHPWRSYVAGAWMHRSDDIQDEWYASMDAQ